MAHLVAMFLLFFLLFDPPSAVAPPPGLKSGGRGANRNKPPSLSFQDLVRSITSNHNDGLVGFQAQLRYSGYRDYLLQIGVGTPAKNLSFIIDTFDDFIRSDCLQNYDPSKTSAYYPNNSTTFITPPCNKQWEEELQKKSCDQLMQCRYNCSSSGLVGFRANDTFRFDGSTPRNLSFACNDEGIYNYSDTSGYVGLGRAPFSMISQLNVAKFSYCFTDQGANTSLSSYMFFGSYADLDGSIAVNTTPLLNDSTDYILDMKGISVGAKRLPIRPETLQYATNSNGTIINGTVIYSTDPVTYLPSEAYKILREEVIAQVGPLPPVYNNSNNNIGLDMCFNGTSNGPLNLSTLTFHFDGADMTLPTSNFLAKYTDANGTSLVCLMINPYFDGYSYLGNYQMQNFQYIYDLQNGKLSFRNVPCDKLQPPKSHAVKLDLHMITLDVLLMLCLLLA